MIVLYLPHPLYLPSNISRGRASADVIHTQKIASIVQLLQARPGRWRNLKVEELVFEATARPASAAQQAKGSTVSAAAIASRPLYDGEQFTKSKLDAANTSRKRKVRITRQIAFRRSSFANTLPRV